MVEWKECERLGLRVKKRKNSENHDSNQIGCVCTTTHTLWVGGAGIFTPLVSRNVVKRGKRGREAKVGGRHRRGW